MKDKQEVYVLIVVWLVALPTLSYSVLVQGEIVRGVVIVVLLMAVYLFWRFVRTHEQLVTVLKSSRIGDLESSGSEGETE